VKNKQHAVTRERGFENLGVKSLCELCLSLIISPNKYFREIIWKRIKFEAILIRNSERNEGLSPAR
jgi:hypothetical protein